MLLNTSHFSSIYYLFAHFTSLLPNDCLYYDWHHITNKSGIMQSRLLQV